MLTCILDKAFRAAPAAAAAGGLMAAIYGLLSRVLLLPSLLMEVLATGPLRSIRCFHHLPWRGRVTAEPKPAQQLDLVQAAHCTN